MKYVSLEKVNTSDRYVFFSKFFENYIKFGLLFLNFGILLSANRFASIYKDGIDLTVSDSVRYVFSLFSQLLLVPFCMLAVTFIRSHLKLKDFDNFFLVLIIFSFGVLKISELFSSLNYKTLAYCLSNTINNAQNVILFFLYLTDYIQQYVNDLPGSQLVLYGIAIGSYGIFAKTASIIFFKMVGFNSTYYTLMYVSYLLVNQILHRYAKKDLNFEPNPSKVNINNIVSWKLTKKLFSVKLYLPLLICISAILAAYISELYGQLKMIALETRKIVSEHYNALAIKKISETINVEDNEKTVKFVTILKMPRTSNFYHYREQIVEMYYCQLLTLAIFLLILAYQKYNIARGKLVLYALVPVVNLINTLITFPSFISIFHNFQSIDQGAKKPLKDISYINFNYETKTFIRLYSEFCLEPISRALGILSGAFIKYLIVPKTPYAIVYSNMIFVRLYVLLIASAWVAVTIAIAMEIEKRKDQKIDLFEN